MTPLPPDALDVKRPPGRPPRKYPVLALYVRVPVDLSDAIDRATYLSRPPDGWKTRAKQDIIVEALYRAFHPEGLAEWLARFPAPRPPRKPRRRSTIEMVRGRRPPRR